jgi:hypothetical protein
MPPKYKELSGKIFATVVRRYDASTTQLHQTDV